jgi:hypothetical protein
MLIFRLPQSMTSPNISLDILHDMLGGSLVTMAWHVLRLWMEGTASGCGWRVAANILNKQ